MLLSLVKETMKNHIFFKYLILISINFVISMNILPAFCQIEEKSKLEVKVNYDETLNQPSFFTNTNLSEYVEVGQVKKLKGLWSGSFQLTKKSIFWTNPKLNKNEVVNRIKYGPYKIFLKFNLGENDRLDSIDIGQEEVMYGSINVQLANKKQINYWATANTDKWFEVIRGKVFRVNKDKLFTVFQTTVYEKKIPIYAFEGISILEKANNK